MMQSSTAGQVLEAASPTAAASHTPYIPGLDGLRAVSILLVMVSHAGFAYVVPGGLGVTVFFVISGFLITNQLVEEATRTRRIDFRAFYLRRLFRLAPALLIYIAVTTPISISLGSHVTVPSVLAAVFYLANYWDLYVKFSYPSSFPILWSLSVEEHYYIIFPMFIAAFLPRLRTFILPVIAATVFALAWRFYIEAACEKSYVSWLLCGVQQTTAMTEAVRIYHGTDTRFDSILAGSLLALAAAFGNKKSGRLFLGNRALIMATALILATLIIRDPVFRSTVRYTLQNFAVAVIIANVVYREGGLFNSVLSLRPMLFIGRISYSLYLWHFAVLVVISEVFGPLNWRSGRFYAFFVVSFVLAVASFVIVEQPMIRLRKRFGSASLAEAT